MKSNTTNKIEGIDFESALTELEGIVTKLDSEVKLEDALQLFEHGMKLSAQCQKFLEQAEQKVEVLKAGIDGNLALTEFSEAE